jgi:hypothetical protein
MWLVGFDKIVGAGFQISAHWEISMSKVIREDSQKLSLHFLPTTKNPRAPQFLCGKFNGYKILLNTFLVTHFACNVFARRLDGKNRRTLAGRACSS